jgi:hypothetical protein
MAFSLTLFSGAVGVLHSVVGVGSKGDSTTTLDTYSHVIPSLRGETTLAMEDVLGEG